MVIYGGRDDINNVAITFDDGPNPEYTPKILKVLKDKKVKATFFLIGKNAEKYPSVVKQIIEEGHDVGNHTYAHENLKDNADNHKLVQEELQKGAEAIKKVTGISNKELKFFRPPGLAWDEKVENIVKPFYGNRVIMSEIGFDDWNWDDSKQWDQKDTNTISNKTSQIIDGVKSKVQNGSIIALHDSAQYGLEEPLAHPNWTKRAIPTFQALPVIIDYLHSRGFSIVKLSQMDLIEEPVRV